MPKKFVGENNKAVEARARKAAKKDADTAQKKKEAEDNLWRDDDKQLAKKQQKKELEEQKKQEALRKKQEAKELLETELNSIKLATAGKQTAAKITRAQIQQEHEKRSKAADALGVPKKQVITHLDTPLEENINRMTIEGEIATNIDEAISVLNSGVDADDKHPEKRMKAAYTAFEERMMPILKADNPTLRLSQLKQLLRKEWQKSPDNPLNQRLRAS